MTYETLDKLFLSYKGAQKSFPFDKITAVYKVGDKMFALLSHRDNVLQSNLKCDPLYALELRSLYKDIIPGYHMNKKHWNTLIISTQLDEELIKELSDHSYDLVFKSLSKKLQAEIGSALKRD